MIYEAAGKVQTHIYKNLLIQFNTLLLKLVFLLFLLKNPEHLWFILNNVVLLLLTGELFTIMLKTVLGIYI